MIKKSYLFTILATAVLVVVALLYFSPDVFEGKVLQQHDTMQGIANGQEGKVFTEQTGETTRWTNSLFSGMPNFQIAPSYPAGKTLSWLGRAFSLWLPVPANLLFALMFGFLIMGLCFGLRWYTALFAAVAWGFSSYFIIIIGAGHIWKFITLAYIPPTIGGLMLCYRGKYLPGIALASVFGALQLQGNHVQMSYYFLFVILFFILAWLWSAIRKHHIRRWLIATACSLLAGCFAVGANAPSLYNSFEYAKETVRGRATDLHPQGTEIKEGMSHDAITAWSYGLDESFSLLIPNVKGGATIKPVEGQYVHLSVADTKKANETPLTPEVRQFISQFNQYFGDQPMTNGPVYVGAFVLLLAVLALFIVNSPVKWALLASSLLALMLSWGHNFAPLTDFFIDYFPAYNKFRAPASILVVVEFCVPLLAALTIRKMIEDPTVIKRNLWTFYVVLGGGALICIVGWLWPSTFGTPFSMNEIEQLQQMGIYNDPQFAPVWQTISESRLSLVSDDSLRSLIFICLGSLLLFLWAKRAFTGKAMFVCSLTALVLIDLFPLDKRYVSSESFTQPQSNETVFNMTQADREILKDTTSNYRVFDIGGLEDARSSYFHKTIGGYHAAKLTRYNDLLNYQIKRNTPGVLNMLNARYFMNGDNYEFNPDALGNAWFVDSLIYVDSSDREMAMLDTLSTGRLAVTENKFRDILGLATPPAPGDTIFETTYAPNRLTYHSNSSKENLAVFSEIYFPWGWKATIDGKTASIGRVDYVLRAMRIPAGKHTIEFTFNPESVKQTNTIAMVSVIAIYILCSVALLLWVLHLFATPETPGNKETKK